MSRIVPKLNLNKTPQLVDNNSLVMAKNIRLLKDGTIGPDTSLEEIEKNVGNGTPYVVHHDAIIKEVTNYQYTILNLDTTIEYVKNGVEIDDVDLEDDAFDFYSYHPVIPGDLNTSAAQDDNPERSGDTNTLKFVKINSDTECGIYCYAHNNESVSWVRERFIYNPNDKELVNDNGYRLYLAVYEDYYNKGVQPPVERVNSFYYVLLPKVLLNQNIIINKYTFIVINPVYPTRETETVVVQEAYDENRIYYDTIKYIGQIVGLDNKIYFFRESNYIEDSPQARKYIRTYYPNEKFVGDNTPNLEPTFDVNSDNYITRRGILFDDVQISYELIPFFINRVRIFEYDEVEETFTVVKCAWKYSGGKITGCVTVNNTGEYILTIAEYDVPDGKLVPIKHINLAKCKWSDDESQYTQAPNIPITNLVSIHKYTKNIPAGVYQFFIRYKIHDNFYTNWFPCSKELFAGTRKQKDTLQGTLKYVDLHEDSNLSFVFNVKHLFKNFCSRFEQFQLGFIISSEGGVFARSWKHFNMNLSETTPIFFEYNKEDIEEINIDDLLKPTFDIFNVCNIVPFKNKLYISNYKETDFNENLANYAKQIKVNFKSKDVLIEGYYFNNIPLIKHDVYDFYYKFGDTYIYDTFRDNVYCNITKTTETINGQEQEVSAETYHQTVDKISKIYIKYNNNNYYIIGGDNIEGNISAETYNDDVVIDTVIDLIKGCIFGIDSNGNYITNILAGNQNVQLNKYCIEYKTYNKRGYHYVEHEPGHAPVGVTEYYITEYIHKITEEVTLKPNIITSSYNYSEYNTLLPFTKYDFYVHYVKQNGIVTNGYFIGTKELNRYTKGYVSIKDPGQSISDMKELQSLNKLEDLCNILSTDSDYAYYDDSSTGIRTFYELSYNDDNFIIYPTFENIICPPGYVSCFISISKYGNNVAQGFNLENLGRNQFKLDCLDLDCLLYNKIDNITIKNSKGVDISNYGVYNSSSTTNPPENIGCSGHVLFMTSEEVTNKCWIILDNINRVYNKTLIKLTPFIQLSNNITSYDNYTDINSPGYYCEVRKLNRTYCDYGYTDDYDNPTGYYVSGNDVYIRNLSEGSINLADINTELQYHNSNVNYIFSNFNLNYVSLTEDLNPIIRRFDVQTEGGNEGGEIITSKKQFITVVNSLICSFILELKSMYRNYTRKLYYEYTKNKLIEFNNTIRSSNIDIDETYRYIYRFEATDYYNVPSQRGIITNLISIANSVYVHCEHSLFKFTDNKTLNAESEEVTLQENDIFNSGITEVFDAQYGYAGLKNKDQSLVTYNAYIFYDEVAKTIYAFGGEQQIGSISDSIQKLINTINPTDVRFVGDELHDRFFVNLINKNGNVCLSFNFNTKSFVSIHDFEFNFGFHSRRNTYFVHENYYNDNPMGWSIYKIVDYVLTLKQRTSSPSQDSIETNGITYLKNYASYQNCYKKSLIHVSDSDDNTILNEVNSVNSCVDIIVNTEYELIKVLNYISWICSEIKSYGNNNNEVSEETLNRKYGGTKLRIYSDSTKTTLIELLNSVGEPKIANENRQYFDEQHNRANSRAWQYPRYNCGVWSMNYFRDIQHSISFDVDADIFEYTDGDNRIGGNPGDSQTTDLTPYITRQNLTQENSLLYGKYFVVRFIFNNKNFKLENLILRMNDYGKTK